jgi:hypothetical protein
LKKVEKTHKAAIGLAVVILLFLTGVSYGAWSETLNLRGMFTTGSFGIEFGEKKDISVDLVTVDGNKVTVQEKITEFNSTYKNDKSLSVRLKREPLNGLKNEGYMLRVKCPLKTKDDSKIKAIKPIDADFSESDDTIEAIPVSIQIIVGGKEVNIGETVNKNNYIIHFNIYKQIKQVTDEYYAYVFLEAKNINVSPAHIPIEYDDLNNILSEYIDISNDNTEINAQLEVEYSLSIPIAVDQFNAGE